MENTKSVEKKKIGIMGGTFNPIHFAHLLLAESAYNQFGLDEVLIMPTKNTYYKQMSNLVSEEDRVAMVRLAIKDNPHFTLSKLELDREGTTYTVETLRRLTKDHPDSEFYFIMGADSLFRIESWREPEEIFAMTNILVAGRGSEGDGSLLTSQIAYLNDKYDASIQHLKSPNMEISSHNIRKRVYNGDSIRYLLPREVADYIFRHGLYGPRSSD